MVMDPIKILKARIAKQSGSAVAKELGVSPAYLSDVMRGKREPGPKILEPLGLVRVVTYRRKQ
jgi:transcriptional regulator with XRE-family HTH domain